ncbi:unnamed protein product [Boreogadus saida]
MMGSRRRGLDTRGDVSSKPPTESNPENSSSADEDMHGRVGEDMNVHQHQCRNVEFLLCCSYWRPEAGAPRRARRLMNEAPCVVAVRHGGETGHLS